VFGCGAEYLGSSRYVTCVLPVGQPLQFCRAAAVDRQLVLHELQPVVGQDVLPEGLYRVVDRTGKPLARVDRCPEHLLNLLGDGADYRREQLGLSPEDVVEDALGCAGLFCDAPGRGMQGAIRTQGRADDVMRLDAMAMFVFLNQKDPPGLRGIRLVGAAEKIITMLVVVPSIAVGVAALFHHGNPAHNSTGVKFSPCQG